MPHTPQALWINVNPSLNQFDQRLCRLLSRQFDIQCWSYQQTADDPCCIETVLSLLDKFLCDQTEPIHIIGHGISGIIALLYTRRQPSRVKSLTLLSVGENPSLSWHSHYYSMRNCLPCNRQEVLHQMAKMLFGSQTRNKTEALIQRLIKSLDTELSPHSLAHFHDFFPGGVKVPLLVCNGACDTVVDPKAHRSWQYWLGSCDRLWRCYQGRHFFHYTHPHETQRIITDFWQEMTFTNIFTPEFSTTV